MDRELSDADLVKQVQAGNSEAMSQLYRRHRSKVYRYTLSKVYYKELAQDITGEVFLRMVKYLPTYSFTGAPFTAWLFRIAHNTLITQSQKEQRTQPFHFDPVELPAYPNEQPDFQVDAQLQKEWIWYGLDQLDDNQREVVILRFIAGLSLKETAHALEKGVGAIKTLQHRGIRALRVALNAKGKGIT